MHEAELREAELRVAAIQIRSPVSGQVAFIHAYPGQAVTAGQPVVTIADPIARSVVVYFREDALSLPEAGATVTLYSKRNRTAFYDSSIVAVGAQVELIPERHWSDPTIPEWGLPVRVGLPRELSLLPGELVGVLFNR